MLLTSGLALSFPFFALYLQRTRGLPMSAVGACLSLVMLAAAVSQGLGGELSDTLGRRRVMEGALWSRTALVLVLAACIHRGSSVLVILLAHVAATFGGNFFDPAARGWISDHCPPSSRVQAYGFLRVALNLGWAVGPAVGGFVAERSYAGMFLATAAVSALCAGLVTLRLRDKEGATRSAGFAPPGMFRAAGDRRFLLFCAFTGLIGVVMAQLIVPLSVHAVRNVHLSEKQVGFLFSINGAIVVAAQYAVSRILSRRPITSALAGGSLLYALGYGAVGFAGTFLWMAAAMVVISLGEVAVSPGLHALAANMAPESMRGRYLGFASFIQQLGFAAGPLLGGFCLQRLGPLWLPGPWIVMAVVGIAAAIGFGVLSGRLRPEEEGLGFEGGI